MVLGIFKLAPRLRDDRHVFISENFEHFQYLTMNQTFFKKTENRL